MSHFTEVKTTIKNIQSLKMACKDMGLELIENGTARGYAGQTVKADYVVKLKGLYDVALNKAADGSYTITTDWWQGHVAKEIGQNGGKLIQHVGVNAAILAARKQGHTVNKKVMQDGSIKVVVGVK